MNEDADVEHPINVLPIMSKSWRTWAFSKKIATFAAKWVAYYDKEYSL